MRRGHKFNAMQWARQLWGVRFHSSRSEPMLLGALWDSNALKSPSHYDGEPTRALLFLTRREAREWCRQQQYAAMAHSPDWRFRPVRVVETVRPVA